MKRMILAAALAATPALAVTLQLDPAHSTASFAVKHMMVSTVHGQFGKMTGSLDWNEQDPTQSKVEAKIDAASVDTREEKRDGHLKSPDFFDTAKCPDITFKSTKVEKADGDKHFKVAGDLTMHCVTKPVTLDVTGPTGPVKSPFGTTNYGITATGKVSRKDFGLVWNKTLEGGGVVLSDDVALEIDAEFVQKPAAGAKDEAKAETKMKKGTK